jgi:hypothetical protein
MERLHSDFNPDTGLRQDFYWDESDIKPRMVVRTTSEVSPIIEANKASFFDDEKKRRGIKKGMWHIATWSPIDEHKLLKRGYVLERMTRKEVERILSDPEFAHCRTTRVKYGI